MSYTDKLKTQSTNQNQVVDRPQNPAQHLANAGMMYKMAGDCFAGVYQDIMQQKVQESPAR